MSDRVRVTGAYNEASFDTYRLPQRELGFALDTERLLVGGSVGNVKMPTIGDIDAKIAEGLADVTAATNNVIPSYIQNIEFMYPFYEKLRTLATGLKVLLCGNSILYGTGAVDAANYAPAPILQKMFQNMGQPNITVLNNAHGSTTTKDWLDTYIATDIAAAADVFLFNHGVNDATIPNSGANAAESLATFRTNLRAGLTLLRAAKTYKQQTIIIASPTAINDTGWVGIRTTEWVRSIIPVLKEAAEDFQCVYIDCLNYMSHANDMWLDTYVLHPRDTGHMMLMDLFMKALYPDVFRKLSRVYLSLTPYGAWVDSTAGITTKLYKDESGICHVQGNVKSGAITEASQIFAAFPSMYAPSQNLTIYNGSYGFYVTFDGKILVQNIASNANVPVHLSWMPI